MAYNKAIVIATAYALEKFTLEIINFSKRKQIIIGITEKINTNIER